MDAAWDLGITTFDTADAYGGGRSETWIGEWLATKGSDVRDRDRDRDEDVQPDGRRARPRPVAVAHPAPGRDEPAAPRGRAGAALSRARVRPRRPAGGDAADVRRARPGRARSAPSAHRTSAASSSPRRSRSRSWRGSSATSGCRTRFSLLEQRRRRDRLPGLPRARARLRGFGPLAGGWLTGKYRRGEALPGGLADDAAARRRTRRIATRRVFDALERLEEEARRARRLDGRSRAGVAARASTR